MERKDMVKECYRAYNTHDANALRAILAEDAELVVPTTKPGEPMRGREAIVKLEAMIFEKLIPDIHEELFHIVIQGDTAAVEAQETVTFTKSASAEGPAVTGRYKINYACIIHVNAEGLIDWAHSYWDTSPWSQQTGIPIDEVHSGVAKSMGLSQ